MSTSRLEKFIYAICSMEVSDLPAPLSRIEKLWNCLITGETPDFEPLSRNEKYLMAMLDRYDISNLPAPMSRSEKLLYKIAVGETDLSDVPGYLSRYEELLKYLIENGRIGNFEYVLYTLNQSLSTLYQTVEKPVKSAILKGSTKYRDIDTGEVLDAFEDGRNLELVSVKMPVLTTTDKSPTIIPFDVLENAEFKNVGGFTSIPLPYELVDVKCIIKIREDYPHNIKFQIGDIEFTDTGDTLIKGKEYVKYISAMNYIKIYNWADITNGHGKEPFLNALKAGSISITLLKDGCKLYPYYGNDIKTNILTVNEPVELRGIRNVQDTLVCLTGEVTERIGEVVLDGNEDWSTYISNEDTISFIGSKVVDAIDKQYDSTNLMSDKLIVSGYGAWSKANNITLNTKSFSICVLKSSLETIDVNGFKKWLSENPIRVQYVKAQESIKTVDLTTVDQDGQPTKLKTFNDISYVEINADNLIPSVDVEVATKISETLSTLGLDHHDISETQDQLGQTIDEQTENTDAAMLATTEIYENL